MSSRMLALVLAVGFGTVSAGEPEPNPKNVKPSKKADPAPAPRAILPHVDKPKTVAEPVSPGP